MDAKSVGIFATVIFALTFVPSLLIGSAFSTMCGTGDITEVSAPDDGHKIVVYNFDCGATTDFSFDVSLLRGNQKLPKYRAAKLLYSHYHQRPTNGPGKNFQIDWLDPTHVVVHIANFDGIPQIKEQDGIEIIFKPLP